MLLKIKGILFFLFIIISFIILVPPWLLFAKIFVPAKYSAHVLPLYFPIALRLFGIRFNVIGKENIDKKHGCVVFSNHQSWLDIPAMIVGVKPVSFLAKRELFKIPVFGTSLLMSGTVPVDRKNPRFNRTLPDRIKKNIDIGYSLVVFPEGTRAIGRELLPFKFGIFKYIQKMPVPCQPVTIINSCELMHKTSIALHSGTITMIVHPIIPPEEIANMNAAEFKDKVESIIKKGMDEHSPNVT